MQDIQTDILMGFAAKILLLVLLSRPYLLPCTGEKRKIKNKNSYWCGDKRSQLPFEA
jgi:hypothetical protein